MSGDVIAFSCFVHYLEFIVQAAHSYPGGWRDFKGLYF